MIAARPLTVEIATRAYAELTDARDVHMLQFIGDSKGLSSSNANIRLYDEAA